MSDYKRFVSYIYGYDQGEKGENTGFVKVNARGGECKIWVHVKGFYAHRQRPYRVYVFTQRKERLEGQYLGELESRNGALEWNGVTETDLSLIHIYRGVSNQFQSSPGSGRTTSLHSKTKI